MSRTPATRRTVEITKRSFVCIRDRRLIVEQEGLEAAAIPIEDLGTIVIDNPAVVLTVGALQACSSGQAELLICDDRHLPASLLLPMQSHTLSARVLRSQVTASEDTCKHLWRTIVQHKIRNQQRLLDVLGIRCVALGRLSRCVAPGDPGNREAQAAQLYWPLLFGKDFRRRGEGGDHVNAALNYGYALLRAAIARAISGAGLHPALGIHHCNQYNNFSLADDLVEPFRPMVDRCIRSHVQTIQATGFNSGCKSELLALLSTPIGINGRMKPLPVAFHEYAVQLRDAISRSRPRIKVPDPWPSGA